MTLKPPNSPKGPIGKASTEIFNIKDSTDRKPLFTDIEITYDPLKMVVVGGGDAFTFIFPGDFVDIHDVLPISLTSSCCVRCIHFTLLRLGSYTFDTRNLFYYVEPSTSADAVARKVSISSEFSFTHQKPESLQKKGVRLVKLAAVLAAKQRV